ncbi:MAG: hypothetical protein ACOCRK_07590, partial [bacterium]
MNTKDIFFHNRNEEFEESIRVDRDFLTNEDKLNLIKYYHVTSEIENIFVDIFKRIMGQSQDMRSGWNHWLYGYYGSGKSHLLTILSLILDTEWVNKIGAKTVWKTLTGDRMSNNELYKTWSEIINNYYLITLPINLLKYQGKVDIGFNDIILKSSHKKQSFSPVIKTAYFEKWYQKQDRWSDRNEDTLKILKGNINLDLFDLKEETSYWKLVQDYELLANQVMPVLFENITGYKDGLNDLIPSNLNPEMVIKELEEWRNKLSNKQEKDAKLILLLDEISLFIGTSYDQLTELNVLAEKIDEIGKGNIMNIITAQERIEDVQPDYYVHKADFSILKDRFPHRHPLPSRHVGKIVQKRLLEKKKEEKESIKNMLTKEVDISPHEILVYKEIRKNTSPPLDNIDLQGLIEYYPLLPYQPALFLEILNNIRSTEDKRAKSVFSGTARAILALVKALIENWQEKDSIYEIINIIDFYNIIVYELEEIMPESINLLKEIEKDDKLNEFDIKVAKAIFLLQFIQEDMISITEPENITVSLIKNLKGKTRFQVQNEVEESINRLQKYIRKDNSKLKFTDLEERNIYKEEEKNMQKDWTELFDIFKSIIWDIVVNELNLPNNLPYRGSDEEYPIKYVFYIDGKHIEKSYGSANGLKIEIAIEGLLPDLNKEEISNNDKLRWVITDKNGKEARKIIKEWAALQEACKDKTLPNSVEKELEVKIENAQNEVIKLLEKKIYKVEDKETSNIIDAISIFIRRHYPAYFHPKMLDINESRLQKLNNIKDSRNLPDWADTIEVTMTASSHHD